MTSALHGTIILLPSFSYITKKWKDGVVKRASVVKNIPYMDMGRKGGDVQIHDLIQSTNMAVVSVCPYHRMWSLESGTCGLHPVYSVPLSSSIERDSLAEVSWGLVAASRC